MKDISIQQEEFMKIVVRNEAIADILGFKSYLPNDHVSESHQEKYKAPMKWYYIKNIGRYNSFELKFHSDYNWLISAAIDISKRYDGLDETDSPLGELFLRIAETTVLHLGMETLWINVSNYALELLRRKQLEKK